nr:S41 family peptidase [Syntrophomonas palmitatica]
MVVLIDENSASASEILSAALQDNQRAVIIGKKSYGKGTVQQIFDLSNEDKVKFTVARFYSPLGNVINKQGVKPDIEVGDDEARLAAELLLYDPPAGYKGKLLKLDTENFQATIDPVRARSAGFWKAWRSIIKGAAGNKFYAGTDNTAWTEISQEERESLWPLFYPDYKTNGPIVTVKPDSELKISLADDVNPRYINFSTVELIKADSGQRVKAGFTVVNKKDIAVKPAAKLTPGEYWLVLHDTIRFSSGQNIGQGIVAKYDVSK